MMKRMMKVLAGAAVAALLAVSCPQPDDDTNNSGKPLVNAAAPAITTHPKSASYPKNGNAAALSVTANVSDGGKLSYQWYRTTENKNSGGTALSGATGAAYPPSTASEGTVYYYVVVTNTNTGVTGVKTAGTTSNTAEVKIVPEGTAIVNAAAPVIATHPKSASYPKNGSAAALSVTASVSDSGTLSYQWYSSTANTSSGGTALDGATGATYPPSTASEGTLYYYVVVTNTNDGVTGVKTASATSNTAEIKIVPEGTAIVNAAAPVIVTQPKSASYPKNGSADALSVTASVSDSGTLSYQWYSNTTNTTSGSTALDGATSATYPPSTASEGTVYYYVVVTNTNDGVTGVKTAGATSNTAEITISAGTPLSAETPNITSQPRDSSYPKNGNAAALSVAASVNDGGTLSYQWYSSTENKNTGGAALSGATGATYPPPTASEGTVYYYVVVTNTITGSTTATTASAVAKIEVVDTAAGTADDPITKVIAATVNINNMDWWKTISAEIQAAGKYVILNLSACTATGNTVSGSYNSSANTMNNIIRNNTYIKGIILPASLTSIGDYAFYNCSSLTSVAIPNSVTSIGSSAFSNCSKLTSVTIGNSVTSIGQTAFYNCGLTSVTIGNSVTSIGEYAFSSCYSLTSVTIPNSVTSIGEYAFSSCYSLTSVTIPNSVTSIGSSAFSVCGKLTSVTIGNSVTSIGENAFYNCTNLTVVNIPDSVTSIGDRAFAICQSLTSVSIGNSVTTIGYRAFYDCRNLTSVTIPNSVTSIGQQAFQSCRNLTSVTFETGSDIASASFGSNVFPEDTNGNGGDRLRSAYLAANPKAGTYTRATNDYTWRKK